MHFCLNTTQLFSLADMVFALDPSNSVVKRLCGTNIDYVLMFQICSLEDVERIMDETRDAVEYQQVSKVF